MRFIFADSLDQIDPGFDFLADEHSSGRVPQRDDVYPHEFFERPPYDGVLVSRAIVGDEHQVGKYSTSQALRFRSLGARRFLRYDPAAWDGMLLGDCGAFSYVQHDEPPYRVEEMVDYYQECGFTHAVSIDHIILENEPAWDVKCDEAMERRWHLTQDLAERFLRRCQDQKASFVPIGVAQGWSPRSYADAAANICDMGYRYLGLGGLAKSGVADIQAVLEEVRRKIPSDIDIHLFGFNRPEALDQVERLGLSSFDSTSPMIRAFKDGKQNYFLGDQWYTAIRIPSADDNPRLKGRVLQDASIQRALRRMEGASLDAVRGYARGEVGLDEAVQVIGAYGWEFARPSEGKVDFDAQVRKKCIEHERNLDRYRETLAARPWERCDCRSCREAGVEVVIFRGNNRNRRRGFHNLWHFYGRHRALSAQIAERCRAV